MTSLLLNVFSPITEPIELFAKGLVGLLAFFNKEVNEVRRQPRLVLSLVLGPSLILILFGAGYQGGQPHLTAALVAPPNAYDPNVLNEVTQRLSSNFTIKPSYTSMQEAEAALRSGAVDMIVILPPALPKNMLNGQQAKVIFESNQVNPINEQWIIYLSYSGVNEINNAILRDQAKGLQDQARIAQQWLGETRNQLDALSANLNETNKQAIQRSLRELRQTVQTLESSPVLDLEAERLGHQPEQVRNDLQRVLQDIDAADQALSNGTVEEQKARLATLRQDIGTLQALAGEFANTDVHLPPGCIHSSCICSCTGLCLG